MTYRHPWIEDGLDDDEMEAVLVAQNPLPPWEPGQIVRAFQTHQWSNASTDGERVCFSHEETGTIVCYDAPVLGIECGHGDLGDALPDLIAVLSDLGWHGAYVFCLAAHMNGVMTDLGRSIPAHLDFDVQEAQRGTRVNEMPEAQSLLDHGRDVLRTEGSGTGAIFRSLDENLPATLPTPNHQLPAITLAEDDNLNEGDDVPIAPTVAFAATAKLGQAVGDDDDGAPRVFSFADAEPAVPVVAALPPPSYVDAAPHAPKAVADRRMPAGIDQQQVVDANRRLTAELLETRQALQNSQTLVGQWLQKAENYHTILTKQEAVIEALGSDLERLRATEHAKSSADTLEASGSGESMQRDAMRSEGLVRVGKSAFYFGTKDGRIVDPDDVQTIANAFEVSVSANNIVHLWPGELRQSVRWDVLGEIDPELPLFASTFAQWAFPGFAGCNMAGVILNKKKEVPFASLRELVNFADKFDHPLTALDMTTEGDAFVDLRKSADDLADEMHEMFTVREVLLSTASRLFVVHVDSLDGPFVQWIVDLLRKVATGYANSARYEKQRLAGMPADITEPAEAAAPPSQEINQEVTAMLGEFIQRLQALGVTVP